jgi:hypothetical protein
VVADKTNTAVAGASITLTRATSTAVQQTTTDENGQFAFAGVEAGTFNIAIAAPGFAAQSIIGELHAGESYIVPPATLAISTVTTEVSVTMSHAEIAEAQIKEEEKQRVLGFVPNYYVSYVPDAASLNTKQKFELAWKTTINPITFALTGAAAGVEQMQDQYGGYGQGAQGYGKRYGATYADVVTGNFIGAALLPSLFKQDPRYFYKGTGSKKSRVLYALANSFIAKGDNGRWQPNDNTRPPSKITAPSCVGAPGLKRLFNKRSLRRPLSSMPPFKWRTIASRPRSTTMAPVRSAAKSVRVCTSISTSAIDELTRLVRTRRGLRLHTASRSKMRLISS